MEAQTKDRGKIAIDTRWLAERLKREMLQGLHSNQMSAVSCSSAIVRRRRVNPDDGCRILPTDRDRLQS